MVQSNTAKFSECMSKGKCTQDDMHILIRFHKTKDGKPLAYDLAQESINLCASAMQELMDFHRMLKTYSNTKPQAEG